MYALEIKDLRKTYANNVEALKGINLSIKTGDFFALLGANGAGKSTTIGLLTTLLNKTSGQIIINGHDLDQTPHIAKMYLGLVPQEFNLNIFETCESILINQAGFYGIPRKQAKARATKLLKQLNLAEKQKTIVRFLSGGMKRRLMIARALMHNPKILILDEPTAGIDIEVRRIVWSFLKELNQQGTTIILTTHYLEEAEQLCKNIAIIHDGTLIKNTSIEEILKTLTCKRFVFDLTTPNQKLPDIPGTEIQQLSESSFEIGIKHDVSLNELFEQLSKKNIQIQNMRNKTNRLEELFMDLIHDEK